MNKRIIMLMAAALALLSAAGQVTFTGPFIEVTPESSTGLNKIYVVYDIQGVGMSIKSSGPTSWYSFDRRGAAYREPIAGVRWDGTTSTLDQVLQNSGTGYVIEGSLGTDSLYFWVVNYADYMLELQGISVIEESPCDQITFDIDGRGDAIPFHDINGGSRELDRKMKLSYTTLEWDESNNRWDSKEVEVNLTGLNHVPTIAPPLCNTVYTISGDCFLEEWKQSGVGNGVQRKTSDLYNTKAVESRVTYEQKERDTDNELEKNLGSQLGGSAPVHIVFTGHPTDAVDYSVWEIASDPNFENVKYSAYDEEVLDYYFEDWGTWYVRYVVANKEANCEYYSEETTFTVVVRESYLECPNFFSPGDGKGANDIWKVTFKSIVEFHCWIYNRWGNLVYEYDDVTGGWDGYYRGKLVDTGVYYYVVRAVGNDGEKWSPRGSITILRYGGGSPTPTGDGTAPN